MTSRVSTPLTICIVAAGVAIVLLARGPSELDAGTPTGSATNGAPKADPVDDAGRDAPDDAGEPDTIRIEGFAFSEGVTVASGATITVRNADGAPHTVTSDAGLFDTGGIDGDGLGSITAPTEAGTYAYFCAIHPSMTATFTVSG